MNREHAPCAVCGADEPKPQYTVYDLIWSQPGEWSFVTCGRCGHGYIDPRPDGPALGALYDSLYVPELLQLMVKVGESGFDRSLRKGRIRDVSAAMAGRTVRRVLDAGCGVGNFIREMKVAFPEAEAIGIETAPAAAELAAQKPGVSIVSDDFERINLPDACVDILTMNHMLEHVPEPRVTLRHAARLVAPGGVVEIELPWLDGWARTLTGRWCWLHLPPQHLQWFTRDGLLKLLKEEGFGEVIQVKTTGYPMLLTAALVLAARFTTGSASPYAKNWLVRGPATVFGFLLLPFTAIIDLLARVLLDPWKGDILRVVARRDGA